MTDLLKQYTQWMDEAGKGNAASFTALVKAIGPRLHRYALRLMNGNKDMADDVLQTVLTKLWVAAPTWNGRDNVVGYTSRMVYNAAMDIYRLREIPHENLPETPVNAIGAQNIFAFERNKTIMNALQKIPDRQRQVIELTYFYDYKIKDIAQVMSTTDKAVEALLIRARKSLAPHLSPDLLEDIA